MNKIGLVVAAALLVAGCRVNTVINNGDEEYSCWCVGMSPDTGELEDFEVSVCATKANANSTCTAACAQSGGMATTYADAGHTCPSKAGQGYVLSGEEVGSDEAELNPATSLATITIDGQQQQVRVAGRVSFMGGCENASCPFSVDQISLAPENFSALHAEVSRIDILNIGAMSATMVRGYFTIPSERVQFLVNASVNGVPKALTFSPDSGQDLHGHYVPSTGSFGLSAQFHSEVGSLQLDLQGVVAR